MESLCRILRRLVPVLVLVEAGGPVDGQGAYRTEEIPQYGIELPIPRKYDGVPAQPTDLFVVRKWFGEPSKSVQGRYDTRPQLLLAVIPKSDDPEGDRTTTRPSDGVVNSFPRFFGQEFPLRGGKRKVGWELGDKRLGEPRKGLRRYEYDSRFRSGPMDLSGRAFCLEDDERIIALYGFCPTEDFEKQARSWLYVADRMELGATGVAVDPKWVRYYERRDKFKDPEFRAKLRSQLPRGWRADDTENYIFLYSTKDEKLIRILKRELEAIRRAYLELFPPVEEIRAVSAVRVCKDQTEYHQYGGSRGSAGYWYSQAKELVFYDQGKGEGRADSRIVLYHEAFHQYIYYSAGEVAPHTWFNEGYGDYFSGARFSRTGDIAKIGVNPWRIRTVKYLVAQGRYVPFGEILYMEKPQFYADAGRCYAQAWSMVYFLRESREVRRRPRWKRILPQYFETLKTVFEDELYALEERKVADPDGPGPEDPEALGEVKKKARDAAIEAALEGVDIHALEAAWVEFIEDLGD